MKKFIVISIMGIFLSIITFGQDTIESKKVESSSTAVELVNTIFDKTTEAVKSLAESLKVPAEHVYEVLVKQQVIVSFSLLIGFLLPLILGSWLTWFAFHDWIKKNNAYNKETEIENPTYKHYDLDDGWWIGGVIFGIIALFVGLIGIIASSGQILTGFINPEYGAINTILQAL